MLEALIIENFQRHKRLEIDLDPNVHSITGPTDSGKSAILRAIRWLCFNRPSGDSFIRRGAKFVRVTAIIDGHTIIRSKGKENLYIVDGKRLKAFGNDVPDRVKAILNVSAANFERQHDSTFWFSQTAGQVSKELNAIVNLSKIDESMQSVSTMERKAKIDVEVVEKSLEQSRKKAIELEWTLDCNEELRYLEGVDVELQGLTASLEGMDYLLIQVVEARSKWKRRAVCRELGEIAVRAGEKLQTISSKRKDMEELVSEIKTAKELIDQGCPSIAKLENAHGWWEMNRIFLRDLEELVERIEKSAEKVRETSEELESANKSLEKKVGKRCPICKRPIKKS